ncbi:MAG: HPr family phosphocarrier protein [Firmicutes bacterium HGW-Firmicutes-7]|nr:MAG: HPr family phosphocarrier protein [Firmicutes bacterium HGW-Firmicutes-7]
MKEAIFTIGNALGIHARPAAEIAKIASQFESSITLYGNERKANAKSLLMIMSLGVTNGQEFVVSAEGKDEDEAIDALSLLISNNFYED